MGMNVIELLRFEKRKNKTKADFSQIFDIIGRITSEWGAEQSKSKALTHTNLHANSFKLNFQQQQQKNIVRYSYLAQLAF